MGGTFAQRLWWAGAELMVGTLCTLIRRNRNPGLKAYNQQR